MINRWKFLSRKVLLNHPRMKLVEDEVELPDGKRIEYIREEPASGYSVAIVAINDIGEVLLQQEYSYPPDKVIYQLPGGAASADEDIIEAANRELSEESGYIGRQCKVIGSFYLNNRRSDRKQYVVLCQDLVKKKLEEDAEEFIGNEWVSLSRIRSLIDEGEIENVGLLAALCLTKLQ